MEVAEIKQVGKRWFVVQMGVKIESGGGTLYGVSGDVIEVSYHYRYRNYLDPHIRCWKLTGKGSRVFRDIIVKAIEEGIERGEYSGRIEN